MLYNNYNNFWFGDHPITILIPWGHHPVIVFAVLCMDEVNAFDILIFLPQAITF